MINVEMMVVMWTTMLKVLSDLKQLGSMEEPKGESFSLYRSTGSDIQ